MLRFIFIAFASFFLLACDRWESDPATDEEEELIEPEKKKLLEKYGGLYPEA